MNIFQKLQQKIWRLIYPIFPHVEHRLLFLHEKKRQKYRIGWLAPHHSLASLKKHLSGKWGFGNHFVAWEDDSQVLSWRKLASFKDQYHIRVYSDGEIRGHFELTPEAAPFLHFYGKGKPRTREFLEFLGPFVTTRRHVSNLFPDSTVPDSDSEVVYSEPK